MRAMPWRRPRAACLALLLGLTLAEEKWSVPQQEHTSSIWGLIHGLRPPVVFRLGSGAQVPHGPVLLQSGGQRADGLQQSGGQRADGLKRGDPSTSPTFKGTFVLPHPVPVRPRLVRTATMISPLIIFIILCLMMPAGGGGGGRDHGFRLPPSWDPAHESTYSFRAYLTDLSMWVLLTDLQPQQQAAAIVMRLQGGAREFARMITPQELMNGGLHNGVMVDPVTYVIAGLHARFSPLEEESRLSAMTEMMAFTRKPGESINAVLSRYEVVRQRAALEGQFTMPIGGCALQLFRAIGVGPQHMMTLLQPIGGQLPTNDLEFATVCQSLRRYGHIQENHPNNIGQALQGAFRQARPGQYFAEAEDQPAQGSSSHTYFGDTQTGRSSTAPLLYNQDINPVPIWDAGDQRVDGSHMPWHGGGQSADSSAAAYPVDVESDPSSSATSSDYEDEDVDMDDFYGETDADTAEAVYLQYRKAKRRWRRFTGRPVRRFRRGFKKFVRKGKGKGKGHRKGKGKGFMYTEEDVSAFLSKGGGKGRSSKFGKGKGRRKNPMGRDGNIMRCRICNSDEHFQRECPNNPGGGGKGGKGKSSTFMPFVAEPSAGGQRADGESSGSRPPWRDDDDNDQFVYSSQVFMSLQNDGQDPLYENDPWPRSRGATSSSFEMVSGQEFANIFAGGRRADGDDRGRAGLGYRPVRSRVNSPRVAGDPRVDPSDDLSDADVAEPPSTPPRPSVSPPLTHYPGFTTPPVPYSITDVGIPMSSGSAGSTPISDGMIQRLHSSVQMAQSVRQSQQPYFRSHLLRHQLPLSVASSNSARLTDQVVSRPPPSSQPTTWQRVQEAVNLAAAAREQRRQQSAAARAEGPRADGMYVDAGDQGVDGIGGAVPPPPMPPASSSMQPPPTPSAPPMETVPVIFVDNDVCSICTGAFQQGETCCRLQCRHVFHAECWTRAMHTANRRAEDPHVFMADTCPNCRSSETNIIAVWNWVSRTGPPTQDVNGVVPRNHLTTDTQVSEQHGSQTRARSWNPLRHWYSSEDSFHIQTQLADGRPAILVDPGSVGNLCGDKWAEKVAATAKKAGLRPTYQKRRSPLNVSGVGNGSQSCEYDCALPVSLRHADDPNKSSKGVLNIPSITDSSLPGLLGLQSLRKNRAVLDFNTLKLYFCGPGDNSIESSLPPGTDIFQLELAPSGHLVLPCCEYGGPLQAGGDSSLTLVSRASEDSNSSSHGGQRADVRPGSSSSGSGNRNNSSSSSRGRSIPPAPAEPPAIQHRERSVGPPPRGHA